MGNIVKILEPKKVIDVVYLRTVTVEYGGVEYTFNEEESDNGTTYYCAIDGGDLVEINWKFDNEVAIELCNKVFTAYREGIVEEDEVSEFNINEIDF